MEDIIINPVYRNSARFPPPFEMTSHVCLICLESGADTPPPCCNGVQTLSFHSQCLQMAWNIQSKQKNPLKCPHCNLPVKNNTSFSSKGNHLVQLAMQGRFTLQGVLHQWFQQAGFWTQMPYYITIKEGLLTAEESSHVLLEFQQEISSILKEEIQKSSGMMISASKTKEEITHSSSHMHEYIQKEENDSQWVHCCIDAKNNVKTIVTLTRTAWVDSMGCFLEDGFEVAAERKRYSARLGAYSYYSTHNKILSE